MKYKEINNYNIEELKDPAEAQAYLNASLELYFKDDDFQAFYKSLDHIVKAKYSIADYSELSGINKEHLYKIFSNKANPHFDTITKMLKTLGFKLEIIKLNSEKQLLAKEPDPLDVAYLNFLKSTLEEWKYEKDDKLIP